MAYQQRVGFRSYGCPQLSARAVASISKGIGLDTSYRDSDVQSAGRPLQGIILNVALPGVAVQFFRFATSRRKKSCKNFGDPLCPHGRFTPSSRGTLEVCWKTTRKASSTCSSTQRKRKAGADSVYSRMKAALVTNVSSRRLNSAHLRQPDE